MRYGDNMRYDVTYVRVIASEVSSLIALLQFVCGWFQKWEGTVSCRRKGGDNISHYCQIVPITGQSGYVTFSLKTIFQLYTVIFVVFISVFTDILFLLYH